MSGAQSYVRDLGRDGFDVVFNGRQCSPTFNSAGAADAYLDALIDGTRKPEYSGDAFRVNEDGETFCTRCELRASVRKGVPTCPECDAPTPEPVTVAPDKPPRVYVLMVSDDVIAVYASREAAEAERARMIAEYEMTIAQARVYFRIEGAELRGEMRA